MGNAQSSRSEKVHAVSRRPSHVTMGLTLKGCTSNASFTSSLPSQTETFVNEKFDRSEFTRLPAVAYTPPAANIVDENAALAYKAFLKHFPEYQLTWILDTLRRTDFSRLEQTGEAYCDYMGGSLYPESLIRVHTDFLKKSILGNTHSVSNASKLSSDCASEARAAVLTFFRAPPEYTVIFTANATGALKLVGESFPFAEGSTYVLGADSHNSVHGIRQFATRRGANVCYIDATDHGGFDVAYAKDVLVRSRPRSRDTTPSLFAMTGLSNISNCKNPMSVAQYASSLGYYTLLDAAALAATSVVSLTETPVDAMAISFYKMFGFPTGVGALVVKKSFLAKLQRPWFAGGTVDVVQVPGNIVTMARDLHEQFEDGTINYLNLPAVTDGLRFLSAYQPFLPLRLSSLMHFLTSSLLRLRHDNTDKPVVQILSKLPKRRLRTVGEQADTGSTVSLIFVSASGDMISNAFIEYAATVKNISLRTGCMCNPGGAAAILGVQEDMCQLYPGVTLKDFECAVGRELGVVRISFGLASSFQDVWRVIQFAATIGNTKSRQALWERYTDALGVGRAF